MPDIFYRAPQCNISWQCRFYCACNASDLAPHRYRPLLSYPDVHVILMCFAIDNPDSLKKIVAKWSQEVYHFSPNVPVILVGNKIDLRNDPATREELSKRNLEPVAAEEGIIVAQRIGAHVYRECSAKTRVGVRGIFDMAAMASLLRLRPRRPGVRLCCVL